jgi:hypothetical protein
MDCSIKRCNHCGTKFIIGYYGSVGAAFWLTLIGILPGIIYWALRGRGERCPNCRRKQFTKFPLYMDERHVIKGEGPSSYYNPD